MKELGKKRRKKVVPFQAQQIISSLPKRARLPRTMPQYARNSIYNPKTNFSFTKRQRWMHLEHKSGRLNR